jgi:signal transduction histidine kinase
VKSFRVRFLLILSIVLTVVSTAITYLNVEQKKESISLVIHTYKVIQASTRLLLLLKDMEIGNRSYLITSDKNFLEPYHEAVLDIDHDMDTLSALVTTSPRQRELLDQRIVPLVARKRADLEESLLIMQRFGRDSATHFAGMKMAQTSMDSIRYWIQDFIQHEQALLKERSENLEQRYFVEDVIRFSSFALIGITSLAALITIANRDRDNKELLNQLTELNVQLEQKVKERTRELEDANKNLLSVNEEKNHFLGITTHDLKAPLTGITGLLNLMKLDSDKLIPRHLEYINLMESTCMDMSRLITDLLDLSRIEHGNIQVNSQMVSLAKVISQLEEHFKAWASRKNIQLVFESKVPGLITDQDVLVRLLDNLISNAIKFSPTGKAVTITMTREGGYVRFDVEDKGPGIKDEDKVKLFKRFQRLSARPTGGESSSGLGLSIVKDLVDLLKGTIVVQSNFGQGTIFTIRIPQSNQS